MNIETTYPTKEELLEGFQAYLEENHTPMSAKRYAWSVMHYLAHEPKPLTANRHRVVAYVGKLRKAGKKDGHLKAELAGIKAFHAYLAKAGLRNDDPIMNFQLKDQKRQTSVYGLLSQEELDCLHEREERYPVLKHRNKAILLILAEMGLASGEICRLCIDDLDDSGNLRVAESTKLNGRTLTVSARLMATILHYLRTERPKLEQPASGNSLFLTMRGTPIKQDDIGSLLESVKDKYPNKKVNAKTVRMAFIYNRLKSGADPFEVMTMTGMKYLSSMMRYMPTEEESLRDKLTRSHPLSSLYESHA